MDKALHVATYLPDFSSGGVERLNMSLMDFLMSRGYRVSAIVHRAVGELRDALPPAVNLVELGATRTLWALPKLTRWLRTEKPDILLSSLGHNNIAALCARFLSGTDTCVIIRQHNALSAESVQMAEWQHRIMPMLYRLMAKRANAIVAVSNGVAHDMANATGLPRDAIVVIQNPVISKSFASEANAAISHAWLDAPHEQVFVGAGRLVPQKDFVMLIRAFALVRAQCQCRLLILGEGPQRKELEQLACELGVEDDVMLLGYCVNPFPYIRKASVFVLSSAYEGFGNVIVEALACGTSVVSTDCPYGPSEILDDGRFGMLVKVGDAAGMAQAMMRMLEEPHSPQVLRERASEFSIDVIGQRYIDLFQRVLHRDRTGVARLA